MTEIGQHLILVDELDNVIGYADKLTVHRDGGQLHRAFSVLIFNSRGEMLLQLRSRNKYHFGGLWTNACCGHPTRGGRLEELASERLRQEFGLDAKLREIFTFVYEAYDPNSGLTEKEFDHVLRGSFDGIAEPNRAEIDDFKWVTMEQLLADVDESAHHYTPWFRILLRKLQTVAR
jgi:isopentenyl-diphosphate delta-isomerase